MLCIIMCVFFREGKACVIKWCVLFCPAHHISPTLHLASAVLDVVVSYFLLNVLGLKINKEIKSRHLKKLIFLVQMFTMTNTIHTDYILYYKASRSLLIFDFHVATAYIKFHKIFLKRFKFED